MRPVNASLSTACRHMTVLGGTAAKEDLRGYKCSSVHCQVPPMASGGCHGHLQSERTPFRSLTGLCSRIGAMGRCASLQPFLYSLVTSLAQHCSLGLPLCTNSSPATHRYIVQSRVYCCNRCFCRGFHTKPPRLSSRSASTTQL